MGDTLRILAIDKPGEDRNPSLFAELRAGGILVATTEMDITARGFRRYFPSAGVVAPIAKTVMDRRPHVIAYFDETGRGGLRAILNAARPSGTPVVWFRGAIGGLNAFSPIDRSLLSHPCLARVVCRSRAMANNWAGSTAMRNLIDAGRIDVAHHVVETRPVDRPGVAELRERLGIGADDLVIGTIAHARPIKNVEFAARAVAGLRSDRRLRFLMIGRCGEALETRLRNLLRSDVVLPGIVPDAGAHAGVFDIFVSPTQRPGEGFGISIAEAMACGVPVVATQTGGAGDLVDHGVTGLLLPENPASWVRGLQGLVDDDDLRRRLGAAGQTRIRERFSPKAIAQDIERILRDVAAESGQGHAD